MDVELNETLSNFHQNNCNGLTIEKKASQGPRMLDFYGYLKTSSVIVFYDFKTEYYKNFV